MTVCDLAAAILVRSQQSPATETAKAEIFETFKRDFPYWSFRDWDAEVPFVAGKAILKIYESDATLTIHSLIVDLPAMVTTFNNLPHKQKS